MFLASNISENESKNGSKITKNRFRATPHQRLKKKVANPKMNPKSWKTGGFFTFSWPRFGGRATNKSVPYCFLQCFLKASVTTYQKQEVFSKKRALLVNLNLSWLMPSGWSRPLHLRCGRICVSVLLLFLCLFVAASFSLCIAVLGMTMQDDVENPTVSGSGHHRQQLLPKGQRSGQRCNATEGPVKLWMALQN